MSGEEKPGFSTEARLFILWGSQKQLLINEE
jgi:hypothetical protein